MGYPLDTVKVPVAALFLDYKLKPNTPFCFSPSFLENSPHDNAFTFITLTYFTLFGCVVFLFFFLKKSKLFSNAILLFGLLLWHFIYLFIY